MYIMAISEDLATKPLAFKQQIGRQGPVNKWRMAIKAPQNPPTRCVKCCILNGQKGECINYPKLYTVGI